MRIYLSKKVNVSIIDALRHGCPLSVMAYSALLKNCSAEGHPAYQQEVSDYYSSQELSKEKPNYSFSLSNEMLKRFFSESEIKNGRISEYIIELLYRYYNFDCGISVKYTGNIKPQIIEKQYSIENTSQINSTPSEAEEKLKKKVSISKTKSESAKAEVIKSPEPETPESQTTSSYEEEQKKKMKPIKNVADLLGSIRMATPEEEAREKANRTPEQLAEIERRKKYFNEKYADVIARENQPKKPDLSMMGGVDIFAMMNKKLKEQNAAKDQEKEDSTDSTKSGN